MSRSGENFFSRFTKNFGWRFAIQMTVMYLLVKGLMLSVLGLVKLSYCKKTLKIDGSACQTMMVISSTPWAIKGSIGVLADAYPLFGYHKASYILVAAVIGSIGLFGLATFPVTSAALSAILLFAVNLEIATSDLLCEGKYAELMQTKPRTGSTMVSYVWGCFQIGSLVAAMFVGPVADHYDPKVKVCERYDYFGLTSNLWCIRFSSGFCCPLRLASSSRPHWDIWLTRFHVSSLFSFLDFD